MLGSTAWCRIEGSLVPRPPVQDWRFWKGTCGMLDDPEKKRFKNAVWSSEYSKSVGSWRVRDGLRWVGEQSASASGGPVTKSASARVDGEKEAVETEYKPDVGEIDDANEEDVLIEFRDVHKSFGSKHILKGASFKIRRGEAVGIIGSSGTGKSTTLRLAAGLLEPDSVRLLCAARILKEHINRFIYNIVVSYHVSSYYFSQLRVKF